MYPARLKWKSIVGVVFVHFLLILGMVVEYTPTHKHEIPHKMMIQNVKLTPKLRKSVLVPLTKVEPIQPQEQSLLAASENLPQPKPETSAQLPPQPSPQSQTKKATSSKKVKSVKKAKKSVDTRLLSTAQESIAKIGQKPDKSSTTKELDLELPRAISSLSVESSPDVLASFDSNYEDELTLYLKSFLILPEYGDVKVSLKLKRNGTIASLKILSAENKKNRKYIEDELPLLKLPPFGTHFSGKDEYTFTLTLSNAV